MQQNVHHEKLLLLYDFWGNLRARDIFEPEILLLKIKKAVIELKV